MKKMMMTLLVLFAACGDANDKSSTGALNQNTDAKCDAVIQTVRKCQPGSDDLWERQKQGCIDNERVDAQLCIECYDASLDECGNCFWLCNPRPRDWDRAQWYCEKIITHQDGCLGGFEGTWSMDECLVAPIDLRQCALCLDSDGCRASCPECDVP